MFVPHPFIETDLCSALIQKTRFPREKLSGQVRFYLGQLPKHSSSSDSTGTNAMENIRPKHAGKEELWE